MPEPITRDELQRLTPTGAKATPLRLIDVRRRAVFQSARDMLPGAVWRDPESVDAWVGEIEDGAPVVVYCVHGHQVGQGVAAALAARGVDARYLLDGIEGWREAGLPLQRPEG